MKISCLGTGSKGNSFHVRFENGSEVILDAGVPPHRFLDQRISMVDVLVLITHEHQDHIAYADKMRSSYGAKLGVSKGTEKFLSKVDYIFLTNHRTEAEGLTIIPFRVIHEGVNPVGYYVSDGNESLIYITDAGMIPKRFADKIDVLIIEANYTPLSVQAENANAYVAGRVISGFGHLSVQQAYEYAEPYLEDLDLLILTHVSKRSFDHEEYRAMQSISDEFKVKARFAESGKVYESLPF